MTNARFSILQARAVTDKRISNAQFRTLAALATFGDRNGWCYPKLATLAKMLGKSKQAVSADIQVLVDCGYIQVTQQYRQDGSQTNNLYRLLYDLDDNPAPHQAELDPHQAELDPHQAELDPPSTSEVDALTSHINDMRPTNKFVGRGANHSPPKDNHKAFAILSDICKVDNKLKRGQLNKAVKQISAAGYTLDDLRQFEHWWYRNDFRGKRGSPPTIQQVIDNLWLSKQMPEILPTASTSPPKRIKYDPYGNPVEVE